MAGELAFRDEAAAEYDRAFAHVTAYFMPFLFAPPILHRVCASLT